VRKGKRRVITGNKSSSLWWLARLMPQRYPGIVKRLG
jgi:hypothetical protein